MVCISVPRSELLSDFQGNKKRATPHPQTELRGTPEHGHGDGRQESHGDRHTEVHDDLAHLAETGEAAEGEEVEVRVEDGVEGPQRDAHVGGPWHGDGPQQAQHLQGRPVAQWASERRTG